MSDSGPIDLADLQLKPQWIDDLDKPNPFAAFEGKDARDDRKPRRDGRGGSGNRGPGGGGAPGQQRGNRPPRPQGDRRQGGGPGGGGNKPQGDRRQGGGNRGPRRDGQGGGRGPRQGGQQRDRQQRPDRPPLYELVDIELLPDQAGVEAVAKQIKMTGRSYPIFDLARLSLGGPDRYHAKFTTKPETTQVQLVECRIDRSLWLSKNEAVRHFSNSPLFSKYYKKQEVEVEAPKGNFTVIAVCGLSGALLGPPNFHSYQKNLMDLHQRKFSRMHIDGYKRKIQMVRDEETIEKWKNSLTKSTQFTYIHGLAEAASKEEAPKEEAPKDEDVPNAEDAAPVDADAAAETPPEAADAPPESTGEAAPAAEEEAPATAGEEAPVAEEATPAAEEESGSAPEAPAELEIPADAPVFKSKAEAEKHFLETHGAEVFAEVKSSTVPGNIPPKLLSGALHNMLTRNAERQQRLPMPMVRKLSPMLEKAGLRFFKLGKKEIYVARSRPRPLGAKLDVSPRIRSIVQYVRDNEKQDLNKLVTALVPNAAAREGSEPTPEEIEFLKDLRWLIREGYVIEFSNGELRLGSLKGPMPSPKGDKSVKGDTPAKPGAKKKKARKRAPRKRNRKPSKSPSFRLRTRVAALKLKRRKARRESESVATPVRRRAGGSAAGAARLARAKRAARA